MHPHDRCHTNSERAMPISSAERKATTSRRRCWLVGGPRMVRKPRWRVVAAAGKTDGALRRGIEAQGETSSNTGPTVHETVGDQGSLAGPPGAQACVTSKQSSGGRSRAVRVTCRRPPHQGTAVSRRSSSGCHVSLLFARSTSGTLFGGLLGKVTSAPLSYFRFEAFAPAFEAY